MSSVRASPSTGPSTNVQCAMVTRDACFSLGTQRLQPDASCPSCPMEMHLLMSMQSAQHACANPNIETSEYMCTASTAIQQSNEINLVFTKTLPAKPSSQPPPTAIAPPTCGPEESGGSGRLPDVQSIAPGPDHRIGMVKLWMQAPEDIQIIWQHILRWASRGVAL